MANLKQYRDDGHSDGTKCYTRSQAIKVIKSILKDDEDLLRGRSINKISDDDILEIGYNFYSIYKV
jgi:hypothetical protein